MKDAATRNAVICGWFLLAVFLPLGLTLEALHAIKLAVYLDSATRREMWTLAHAHGNLLGLLCVVYGAVGRRAVKDDKVRMSVSRFLCVGAVVMPVGFFLGGVLNRDGDPSPGILLVPVGAVCLLYALVRAGIEAREKGS